MRNPATSFLFAGLVLCVGFFTEPLMPLGDERWLYGALLCAIGIVVLNGRKWSLDSESDPSRERGPGDTH